MRRVLAAQVPTRGGARVARRAACLFALGLACGATARAATLEEAVQEALTTHPQIGGAEAELRAAGHDLDQAKAARLPSVDVDTRLGLEHINIKQFSRFNPDDNYLRREAGVTVSQMLWDGLATSGEIERRVALLNSAEHSLEDTRNSIAFRAVQAYFDLMRTRELMALARGNVESLERVLANVEAKATSGVGNRADVAQASARVALAHSTVMVRDDALREAEARYRRTVGEPPAEQARPNVTSPGLARDGEVDKSGLDSATRAAEEQAAVVHPAVLRSSADAAAALAALKAARAPYQPRLDLLGTLRRDADLGGVQGTRNSDTLMLVARWNLFRGGADRAEELARAERRTAAELRLADTLRAIVENVDIAMESLATSEARLAFLEQHVQSSRAALDAYRAQFEISRRTLLDLLNAEDELFSARSNQVAGTYEFLTNVYFVEASKGLLASEFDVGEVAP
ncbi:MAG: TolC family outer membrane protein [Gammaproteobacteria bacterium]